MNLLRIFNKSVKVVVEEHIYTLERGMLIENTF